MPAPPLVLALDQGTTSSRAIAFDGEGRIAAVAQQEFPQIFPAEGWVEHDPEAIWTTTLKTARQAVTEAEAKGGKVVAVGVANQRETTILWDRASGKPLHNAIVWQDRRTARTTERLAKDGLGPEVAEKTGLVLDPYFSATKAAWILDHVDGARARADAGEVAFGTVDSFLICRLTGGKVHATDATNASRTSLYDIVRGRWDEGLGEAFGVPAAVLPEVRDCAADYGETLPELFGRALPILGVAGDQQAAAIGQGCFTSGDVKSTYGTGCFVLVHTAGEVVRSQNRLLTTIACRLEGKTAYALEGSIFIAGAAVQWLRDRLHLIKSAPETEALAAGAESGVYMVPAFTGLGAPHWDADARGAIFGLTRASGAAELARAALDAVCFQSNDLLEAVAQDGVRPGVLRVDGGMSANDWVMQRLADFAKLTVERPPVLETTALGAARLAGWKAGVYDHPAKYGGKGDGHVRFAPNMAAAERERLVAGWRQAVAACLAFKPERP